MDGGTGHWRRQYPAVYYVVAHVVQFVLVELYSGLGRYASILGRHFHITFIILRRVVTSGMHKSD